MGNPANNPNQRCGHCGKLAPFVWCPNMTPRTLALPVFLALAACAHTPEPVSGTPQVLLLGEVHDNAAGHAARAQLLQSKLAAGWRPAVAMEQFDTDQQPALDAAMRSCADAACVIAQVAPANAGWMWNYYTPVIALALQYKLPLYAANLSRSEASKVVKGGFAAALPADLIAHYSLNTLPATVLAAQENEVRTSHCGALPEAFVNPMGKAQIARDVVMAQILRTHASNGIVLIAGNGHVRSDIAVPFWLQRDGLRVHTVGFLEPNTNTTVFDEVKHIPASTRADPCAGFKLSAPAG